MQFIEYPKCSTCKKAKQWLLDNNVPFDARNIKDNNPSFEELKKWKEIGNIQINKMFNTSGLLYKEMNLKNKLEAMDENQKIELLASNGMLVKRPIIIDNDKVIFGFKEDKYKELLK